MSESGQPIETDALVIGAGPVGLFQAFQLGLLEVKTHIVDSLPYVGGQCVELYGDKPIYDIPSVDVCTGRELADRLLRQIAPFKVPLHLSAVVVGLSRQGDGRWLAQTRRGAARCSSFLARTVFIAGGVGAFLPRKIKVEGLDRFEGSQLLYRSAPEQDVFGKHVIVMGGDAGALDTAVELAGRTERPPASVTLLHRRKVLDAPAEQIAQMDALCETGRMKFVIGQITGCEAADDRLQSVLVTDPDAQTHALTADLLLVLLGLSPKLGPIADWGLALERKQIVVDTEGFQTSEPGIFAVGDVNTYPGKKKLIVCGFHEATLAAWAAAPIVFPEKKLALQYTTTSPRLHQLLGVGTEPAS
ncbi:MAG: NAD(P)/FAD-dependent oxidoreductase [Burkholderiales bacterium]